MSQVGNRDVLVGAVEGLLIVTAHLVQGMQATKDQCQPGFLRLGPQVLIDLPPDLVLLYRPFHALEFIQSQDQDATI